MRFGTAKVEDYNDALGNHAGARITCGASFDALANRWVFDRTKFTPTDSMGFNSPGESCWPGANRKWTVNPCDHDSVNMTGWPAETSYAGLVESTPGPGVMCEQVAGLPPVTLVYQPSPAPAAPTVVPVRMQAVAEPVAQLDAARAAVGPGALGQNLHHQGEARHRPGQPVAWRQGHASSRGRERMEHPAERNIVVRRDSRQG